MLLDDIEGFAGRYGRGEWAEVAVAVLDDLAGGENPRPGMLGCDFDAEIALIVLEPDVVAGFVLLDQIVFENQRFLIASRDQCVEIADAAHQELDLRTLIGTVEIRTHSSAQIFR